MFTKLGKLIILTLSVCALFAIGIQPQTATQNDSSTMDLAFTVSSGSSAMSVSWIDHNGTPITDMEFRDDHVGAPAPASTPYVFTHIAPIYVKVNITGLLSDSLGPNKEYAIGVEVDNVNGYNSIVNTADAADYISCYIVAVTPDVYHDLLNVANVASPHATGLYKIYATGESSSNISLSNHSILMQYTNDTESNVTDIFSHEVHLTGSSATPGALYTLGYTAIIYTDLVV